MNKEKTKLLLDKVGTVLVDRRFWINVVLPVAWLLGYPYFKDYPEQAADAAVFWSGYIVPIVSSWVLGFNWSKRPPSGTKFKEVTSEVEELIKILNESLTKEG